MTVTAHFFGKGVLNIWKKKMDLSTDTLKIALFNSSLDLETNRDVYAQYSDVSADEISGTGYTVGGVALSNVAVSLDTANHLVKLTADDPAWENATITAHYAIIYDVTAGNLLVGFVDFGQDESTSNIEFKIDFGGIPIRDTLN